VGGHVGRLGVRADGELQRRYIRDLDDSVKQTMTSLDPTPFFQQYGATGNAWAIFKTYLAAAAQQAAEPIVTKYLDKLSGADVFTVDNAYTLFESLRIDAGTLGPFGIRP
jgi:cobalamin-dependent methionine synthase I